jgi:GNAT superfamily N-acetyltransferase
VYWIGWLVVTKSHRRSGLGTAIVEHVVREISSPAEFVVITFGPGVRGGEPARRFYAQTGFAPAETVEPGPGGTPRQAFRRRIDSDGAPVETHSLAVHARDEASEA